ncbi:MAG: NUDIX hydrolase [Candidatus Hydrogenedentes bacterium]|nr:NUDIX hydrolase [Candidatus Hydrogenedentota bacterium]
MYDYTEKNLIVSSYVYEYPRPMVTVDAVVFCDSGANRHIALIRRRNEPYADCWALPGGFVEMGESLAAAAARELMEETGLCNIPLRQFYAFGNPGRDPRGRNICIAYVGMLSETASLCAADDAVEAVWFPVPSLPPLAFDHDKIVAMALEMVEKSL